jgi:ATP/ADP translocase
VDYDLAMSLKKYMVLPVIIFAIGIIYWFLSYEAAGAVMLVVFAAAMALFGWTLLPTASNVGPTAPVDPDFQQPTRR